jgi:hypothetical protein
MRRAVLVLVGFPKGLHAATYMIKEFWPDLRKRSKHKSDAAG